MKNTILILLLMLGLTNCQHFEELNIDPAQPTQTEIDKVITNVEALMSGSRESIWGYNYTFGMGITQQLAGQWAIGQGSVYHKASYLMDRLWNTHYEYIQNLRIALHDVKGQPDMQNHYIVANTLMIYLFAQLTDTYGDIPYFQAGKGYLEELYFPEYDAQEEIYNHFFEELQAMHNQIAQGSQGNVKGDVFFNGNMQKWQRLINSLHLRLALRLVHVNEAKAKEEASKAIQAGLMQSNEDMLVMRHENFPYSAGLDELRGNGLSQTFHFGGAERICSTFSDMLYHKNDPRLTIMFGVFQGDAFTGSIDVTEEFGKYLGHPAGYFLWDVPNKNPTDTVIIEDGTKLPLEYVDQLLQARREMTRLDAPYVHMTYTEVELLQAEAAHRWQVTGEPAAVHYEKALRAHEVMLREVYGCPPSLNGDMDTYLEEYPLTTGQELRQINEQLYINHFLNGQEAFANWRRSGYPELKVAPPTGDMDPELNGRIPRSFEYPNDELTYNGENVRKALDGKRNFWGNTVWWDTDPMRGVLP
ncbi:SusD/RagB family nutrient-binding outer membrane lipoprotein [Rapidithrix thailandica]|uniref:SusD/RagB family nutrient-binding outer membrane lipoprotein n=1 Tax=Rapidithrix thailandica TaxID=413964 RepID=A0AAW9S1P4_9BACT